MREIDLIFQMYLKAKISYDHDIRVEDYPFARDAIREAIQNGYSAQLTAMPEGDKKAIRKSILVRVGKDSYRFKFNEKNVASKFIKEYSYLILPYLSSRAVNDC